MMPCDPRQEIPSAFPLSFTGEAIVLTSHPRRQLHITLSTGAARKGTVIQRPPQRTKNLAVPGDSRKSRSLYARADSN